MSLASIYERIEEETEPKISLVVRAYDRVIELLEEACEGTVSHDYNPLSKAAAIISELLSALDFDKGKHIAESLKELYLFSLGRIVEAEKTGDTSELRGVIGIFKELREAWDVASKEYLKG